MIAMTTTKSTSVNAARFFMCPPVAGNRCSRSERWTRYVRRHLGMRSLFGIGPLGLFAIQRLGHSPLKGTFLPPFFSATKIAGALQRDKEFLAGWDHRDHTTDRHSRDGSDRICRSGLPENGAVRRKEIACLVWAKDEAPLGILTTSPASGVQPFSSPAAPPTRERGPGAVADRRAPLDAATTRVARPRRRAAAG